MAAVQWTQQYGGADGQSTGASLAVDPQGSSVLDALGLPRGTISLNQSVDLTAMTTLRAGDSFKIKIDGVAPRTTTITIDPGETINSLSTKINAQLGAIGKAAANYTGSAEGLKLTVNPGNTIESDRGARRFGCAGAAGHHCRRVDRACHRQQVDQLQHHQQRSEQQDPDDLRPGP